MDKISSAQRVRQGAALLVAAGAFALAFSVLDL